MQFFSLSILFAALLISQQGFAQFRCGHFFIGNERIRSLQNETVLKTGSVIQVRGPNSGLLPTIAYVLGEYGGKLLALSDSAQEDLIEIPKVMLEDAGLQVDVPQWPRIVPQVGPTCLPAAIGYVQELESETNPIVRATPNFMRVNWMSLFMTYSWPVATMGSLAQMPMIEVGLHYSNLTFGETTDVNDVMTHLRSGKNALLGIGVSSRLLFITNALTGETQRKKAVAPLVYSEGPHAMVAVGAFKTASKEFAIIVDPLSGELMAVDTHQIKMNLIRGFLID